jgi:predicted GIY-YIG superfamily endonuclease
MIHYLYLITRLDGERYVGVTKDPHRRGWQHRNGYGSSELKGQDFTLEILEEGEESFIYLLEDAAIKAYKCSLNKVVGGKFGHGLQGIANGRAKLTEADVYLIKCLAAKKIPQKEIAERFGVSRQTIGGIATGANWKHVKGPITYGRSCVPEELRCQLKYLKEKGMNAAEIARHTGLKYTTVYSHVREIE